MKCFITIIAVAGALALSPAVIAAQTCSLGLSDFQAALDAYKTDVSDVSSQLSTSFVRFEELSASEAANPESCPTGLAQSRTAAVSLDVGALTERGETMLECAFFFNERVLADMDRALSANDSQLLLRLGEIQKRVFRIDAEATEASKQAIFLDFRVQALVSEHDVVSRRCTLLGSIYD